MLVWIRELIKSLPRDLRADEYIRRCGENGMQVTIIYISLSVLMLSQKKLNWVDIRY